MERAKLIFFSVLLSAVPTLSLSPITISGNAFFQGSDRFYLRGVDYILNDTASSLGIDPIANQAQCERDIPEFTSLGVNTVRVYLVDNSLNHDECMTALADAGIYVIVNTENVLYSLNSSAPEESYTSDYLQNVFATIDAFAKYTNILGFISGDDVVSNDVQNSASNNVANTLPYIKAVVRDMKQYIGSRGYRSIPVGYAASYTPYVEQILLAEYLNCGTDDQRSDFFAHDDYGWCDDGSFNSSQASFTGSGWESSVTGLKEYGIPVFFSEFGCISGGNRTFVEIETLYSTDMTGVYSGGFVYEYADDGTGYGLVDISGNSVMETADFGYLQSQYGKTTNPTGGGGYNSSGGASTCPSLSTNWPLNSDALPAIPGLAEDYMATGAGPGVGLSGPGSQGKGAESTGTATAQSSQTTGTGRSSPTGSSDSTSSSSASHSPKNDSKALSGLSIGAKVGIAVGISIVGLAAIVGALLLFLRSRKGSLSLQHSNEERRLPGMAGHAPIRSGHNSSGGAHAGPMSRVEHQPPAAPLYQPHGTNLNLPESVEAGFRNSDSGQETGWPSTALGGENDEEIAIHNPPDEEAARPKNWRVSHYFHSAIQSLDLVSDGHQHEERT